MDWLERCHWERRSGEFGSLRMQGLRVEMAYLPPLPEQTWRAWRHLPLHPNILAVASGNFLHYAALDWSHDRLVLSTPEAISRFATWGLRLARVYEHVAMDAREAAWLAHPLVKFDVEGVMRVGFLPPELSRMPAEAADQWPLCDERALVHVVATTLIELATEIAWDSQLGSVLSRARDADPENRYASLATLRSALLVVGAKAIPPTAQARSRSWSLIETALGLAAVDRASLALSEVKEAARLDPRSKAARALVEVFAKEADRPARPTASTTPHWQDVRARGANREHARDFAGALVIYEQAPCETDAERIEHALARARCRFELGCFDDVVVLAREVLGRDPGSREARALEARALLAVKRWPDALRAAEAWLAITPDEGPAHHARGKALLGLNRLAEARDAFDLACLRAPALIAAMWLRGAVDKALKNVRMATGTPLPMPIDLPEGAVRDALLAGRIDDAIALLGPSQLQGELLSYRGRFEDALRVFEQLDDDAALAGRARALIDLGRTEEALAILGTIDADADGFVTVRR